MDNCLFNIIVSVWLVMYNGQLDIILTLSNNSLISAQLQNNGYFQIGIKVKHAQLLFELFFLDISVYECIFLITFIFCKLFYFNIHSTFLPMYLLK